MKKTWWRKVQNLSATNFENTFEDTHWRKVMYRHPSPFSYVVSGKAVALLVKSFYAQENHT